MRGVAIGGITSTMMVAACGLGVVDIPPDPSPAQLFVSSAIGADPSDPSRVQVVVRATLDPGIGRDGSPRRITDDAFHVEGAAHSPSGSGDPSRPTWLATISYATPGPEGVRLGIPRLEGLGLAESITMRVRVDVTPDGTIVLGDGEDLVITAEPPSNPAQTLEWSLDLTSAAMPAYALRMGGTDSWPSEVRVPADQIPASALPLRAALQIRWYRTLNLFSLTPDERYDLTLGSIMNVVWTVEAGS